MRIGFASDFHLGFGTGKRKDDARVQAERAMKKLLENDCDLIVVAGDVFDTPVPRPEVLRDAAQVFRLARKKSSDVKLTGVGRDSPEFSGTPVVAIHGNHERRVRGEINPVKLMDVMGYLIYLQDEGVLCGDYGIYGVGSVPESYASKVFSSLRAKPFGSTSFFVFHQDLHPYIPMAKLETKHLPRGFTYYVNGHIHSPRLEKNILVVGSTVVTQMKEDEAEKFVWMWDRGFEKLPIASRPMYRVEVNAAGRSPSEVLSEVNDALANILKKEHAEDPMIRVKVSGKLADGFKPSDLIFTNDFGAVVSFDKKLEGSAIQEIGLEHFDLDELAVGSMKRVLEEKGLNLDPVRLYGLLMRGDEAAVWKMLEELK